MFGSLGLLCTQGSVLGPRMFIMFMSDLAELADEQRVNLHSYADDSQIYVHCSPSGVVSVVQQLEGCISEVSLPLDVRKSSEAKHG